MLWLSLKAGFSSSKSSVSNMAFLSWYCALTFLSIGWVQAQDEAIWNPDDSIDHLVIEYSEPGDEAAHQIVGGTVTNINDHPHQIQLLYNGGFRCGGSILSRRTIVTAAHCTRGIRANQLSIRAGSSTLSGGTVIRVQSKEEHPQFNANSLNNDVSILQLASPLTYRAGINKIALATAVPSAGSTVTVTGWGRTSEGGSISNQLRVIRVPVVAFNTCARRYRLTNNMICAGQAGRDACNGDSGGPMSFNGRLVGIVSFGLGCARPAYPGVYASVPATRSWIYSKIISDS